jgi:hypothetical protein
MKLWSRGIMLRRAALLGLAVAGIALYAADDASAWSYFWAHLEGTYQLGGALTFTAEGSLADPERIFVFVESTKCEGTPAREEATTGPRRLTPPEGEPLNTGSYLKTYTYTVATLHQLSGICEYIGAYTPAFSERDAGVAMCEQEPGNNGGIEVPGRCSMPSISQAELEAIKQNELKQHGEAENLQMWAAQKQREEARIEDAIKRAKEAEALRAKSRCTVPRLHGHTLNASRHLLVSAHCKLAKVRVRHGGRGPLMVVAQTPKRNATLPSGGHVSVTLGRRSTAVQLRDRLPLLAD